MLTFKLLISKLNRSIFTFLLLLFISSPILSQVKDTVFIPAKADTVKFHSPKKAALMSAALPGLGQIYNKKYWKVPVLYVALGGLIYSLTTNQMKYADYRDAYKYSVDKDPTTINIYAGQYRDEQLFDLQYKYNRRRNLSVIGIAVLYLMNVVDASVDAHLYTFDVSDDLTLNIQPALINTSFCNQYLAGVSLNIKF